MGRILLIEDEEHISKGIKINLEFKGHDVIVAKRGNTGLEIWKEENFDLLILDLMLPGISGEKVLEEIRSHDDKTPIIIISAKDRVKSKINCFNLGSDDYLVKPFSLDEFLLRVERHLKRSSWVSQSIEKKYFFGDNWINFSLLKAFSRQMGEFHPTEQELILLEYLFSHEGKIIKRKELLELIGYSEKSNTRTIDNFIVRFRKYFEENPKEPRYFISVRSVGYLFKNQLNKGKEKKK